MEEEKEGKKGAFSFDFVECEVIVGYSRERVDHLESKYPFVSRPTAPSLHS